MKKLLFNKKRLTRLIAISLLFVPLFISLSHKNSFASNYWDYISRLVGSGVMVKIPIYMTSTEAEIKSSLQEINGIAGNYRSVLSGNLGLYYKSSFFEKVAVLTWDVYYRDWEEFYVVDECHDYFDEFGVLRTSCTTVTKRCTFLAEADYKVYRISNGTTQQIANIVNGSHSGWTFDFVKWKLAGFSYPNHVSFYDSLHDVPPGTTLSYRIDADIQKYIPSRCEKARRDLSNYSVTQSFDINGDGFADFVDPGKILAPVIIPSIMLII